MNEQEKEVQTVSSSDVGTLTADQIAGGVQTGVADASSCAPLPKEEAKAEEEKADNGEG